MQKQKYSHAIRYRLYLMVPYWFTLGDGWNRWA